MRSFPCFELLWKRSPTEQRWSPNSWSFLDPMPVVISMGFQMLTWLWSITIGIRPNGWHALSRNKDWRMMYWPWSQKNGIRKRNLIRFSGNRSFKKVYASMSIPENPWFLQAEDDLKMAKLAFANGFYSQTWLPCLTVRWKSAQEYHHRPGWIASQNPCIESFEGNVVPTWAAYLWFRRFEIEFSYTHAYQHSLSFWGSSSCAIIWSIGWRRVFGNCWESYQFYKDDEEGRRLSITMSFTPRRQNLLFRLNVIVGVEVSTSRIPSIHFWILQLRAKALRAEW